jgi:3-oxoacyl-(acyl-carrier-protein) synthase
MKLYIRGTGNISPQRTFGNAGFPGTPVNYSTERLACIEPDYKAYIDAKLIRRMSRIIKMGVAAAMECLQEAAVAVPDAIVTGTAYGCLEDTGVFLSKIVEQKEELLAPTAFIQSTHNTVGAQIALMLHCNGYNNVFVHRGFSFESALLDAMLLLQEQEARHVLVGGVDEITTQSHAILSRFGQYRQPPLSSLQLFNHQLPGTIAGEGAAFFLLATEPSSTDYAVITGLTTFYKPRDKTETGTHIRNFLASHSLQVSEIDLLVLGRNGDHMMDSVFEELGTSLFGDVPQVNYKHLCGEYPTSTAFALWMAAKIVKTQILPEVLDVKLRYERPLKNILIYNHSQGVHHSLLLISAC